MRSSCWRKRVVVDIAFDGGQSGLEQLLNGKKSGWHEARL